MDPPAGLSTTEANQEVPLSAMDPPQGPSNSILSPPEVTSAATEPAQRHSTTSGDVKVTLTAGGPLYDHGPQGNLSWDVHATSLVYAMTFFDCKVRMTHNALQSLGFMCKLEDVMNCRQHEGFVKYTEVTHPVGGYVVTTSIFQSGVKATRTADYLNGKLIAVTWRNELLRARTPRWKQLLCSLDGREIIVELNDGQLQVRVLDHPAPDVTSS